MYIQSVAKAFLTSSIMNVFCRYIDECPRLSSGAKDLIRQLLTIDPNQRLSAKHALVHPWVLGADDDIKVARPTKRKAALEEAAPTKRKATATLEGSHSKKMKPSDSFETL